MVIFNKVTGEMEFIPSAMCFAEGEGEGEGQGGGEGEGYAWPEDMPAELNTIAERFDGPQAALQSISDMRKRESQVRVPGADANESEVAAYHKAIGVPEDVADYQWPEVEEVTEAITAERTLWGDAFKANGVSTEQASALVTLFAEQQVAAQEAIVAADKTHVDEQRALLKTEWGNQYEAREIQAGLGLETFAKASGVSLDALKQIEMKDGRFLLENASVLRLFQAVGAAVEQGTAGGIKMGAAEMETTGQEVTKLREQIVEATGKGDHKLANALHQKEIALLEKMPAAA